MTEKLKKKNIKSEILYFGNFFVKKYVKALYNKSSE